MFRIFGFTSLLCSLLAFAVRQGMDLHDSALSFAGDERQTEEAQEAQATVRKQHAVFGHTALKTMNVYSIQAVEGVCRDVIKKVSDLAKEELALPSTESRAIDEDVDRAFLRDSSEKGQRVLSEAFAVLDQSDLRDVMNTGDLWTLGDQDILVQCETNASIRIEEEARTASGEELLQGDMVVLSAESGSFLELSEGSRWVSQTWPRNSRKKDLTFVPYCFDPSLDEGAKTAFLAAINHTSSQVPCIHFIDVGYNDGGAPPRMHANLNSEQFAEALLHKSCNVVPSIKVQDADHTRCFSPVGMRVDSSYKELTAKLLAARLSSQHMMSHLGPEEPDSINVKEAIGRQQSQVLNLGYPCQTMAVAAHELGHALGMLHEQSRTDRDDYITVHWDNIPEDRQHNFVMQVESWQAQVYDPLSLMHYDKTAFAEDAKRPTITANNLKLTALLGQRQGWSEQDVLELAGKYCSKKGNAQKDAHEARPAIRQQALLDRLIGKDFKPVSKFSQLLVPSPTPSFCVQFTRSRDYGIRGCDANNDILTDTHQYADSCQWEKIQNVCSTRVLISCPHDGHSQPLTLYPKGTMHDSIRARRFMDSISSRMGKKDGFVKETWKELEMGVCGVYIEP